MLIIVSESEAVPRGGLASFSVDGVIRSTAERPTQLDPSVIYDRMMSGEMHTGEYMEDRYGRQLSPGAVMEHKTAEAGRIYGRLASSIEQTGVQRPIMVMPGIEGAPDKLLEGHHRVAIAHQLQQSTGRQYHVPVNYVTQHELDNPEPEAPRKPVAAPVYDDDIG